MVITYYLTFYDFILFYKKHLKDNSFIFKNYVFFIAFFAAALIHLIFGPIHYKNYTNCIVSSEGETSFIFGTFLNLIFCIIFVFLFRLVTIRRLKKNLAKNLSMIGIRNLEFTDNYKIILSTDNSTKEYDCSIIQKIVEASDYYYLYIDNHTAIIVPKKAVQSDELIKSISNKINGC